MTQSIILSRILKIFSFTVPGGSIAQDGDKLCKTTACIFETPDDMTSMRNFEQVNSCQVKFANAVPSTTSHFHRCSQVFVKLMRRYKYLEKMFYEEMKKVLIFIKGFTESERTKLARMTALWIANNTVQPQVLNVLINVSHRQFIGSEHCLHRSTRNSVFIFFFLCSRNIS